MLRFWESPTYFVVLGSSNKHHDEVHGELCRADGIPILRRHSGGGTVLQGPGCLNYALVLRIGLHTATRTITSTTNYVMNRHAEALSDLLKIKVEVNGSSDLTIGRRKISGNAQRRRLTSLLFHGTLLLDFDLSLVEKYLKLPPKQPAYRAQRSHREFLTNIETDHAAVKRSLARRWNTTEALEEIPSAQIARLVREKYASAEWNFRI